jgi:sphingosine kinase
LRKGGGNADRETCSSLDASQAYICVPQALVLYCSFIPDSDGGSLLLRLLTPPSTTDRSSLLPFKPTQNRASLVVEQREKLDKDPSLTKQDRLSAQLQGPCSSLRLVNIEARVGEVALIEEAKEWALNLMELAYTNLKPYRKLKMLVNPVGGSGQGLKLFHTKIKPILEAAGCTLDVTLTTHVNHGVEVVRALPLDQGIDAIVCVSGDGMVHEVLNGLATREDAHEAMKIPVAPIPAGSGNAVAVNLLGPAQGFNLALACLNVIKGQAIFMDVCTITQPADSRDGSTVQPFNRATTKTKKRPSSATSSTAEAASPNLISESPALPYTLSYTFLSQAIGLMADIDLGTEDMRALGDTRFILGYIGGILANKECEIDVYVKLGKRGTTNKREMRRRVEEANKAGPRDKAIEEEETQSPTSLRNGAVTDPLPNADEIPILDLRDPSWQSHLVGTDEDGEHQATDPSKWYRIAAPIAALYGGKIPYVARDLMSFPYAYPGDSCVDFVFQLMSGGRKTFIKAIQDGGSGTHVYNPAMVYLKVDAYRIVPRLEEGSKKLRKGGLISIDGEHRPYRSFQVEVHQSLHFRVLSLYGRFCVPVVTAPANTEANAAS